MRRRVRPTWWWASSLVVLGVAYYGSARLSLLLSLVGRSVTPLWLPTGVALVGLAGRGLRVWPAVFVAAFAVNLPISSSAWVALGIAVGNTAAPVAAVTILRTVRFDKNLNRPRDAILLIAAGLSSTTISASVGTSLLFGSAAIPASHFGSTWLVWWTGDAMGMILFAPFLWSLRHLGRPRRWLHLAEAIGMYAVLAGSVLLAVGISEPVLYLALPILAGIAWRFQQRGAAPAGLLASLIITLAAVHNVGQFAHAQLATRMITLQSFNAIVSCTTLLFAAAVTERAALVSRLQEIAMVTQEAIIRPPAAVIGSVALAARYVSATDHAMVGGDLYDAALTPFGVRLFIGDVRGKGIDAVQTAAAALRSFRRAVQTAPDLVGLALEVADQTSIDLDPGEFITALFAEITEDGHLRLVNLGHHAPLHLDRDGVVRALEPTVRSQPLGLSPTPAIDEHELASSDRVLFFTDGLIEGRDRAHSFFPLREVARDVLFSSDLDIALSDLLERYRSHVADTVTDDIAVLLVALVPRFAMRTPG